MADHLGDFDSVAWSDGVWERDFDVSIAVMAYCFLYREQMREIR